MVMRIIYLTSLIVTLCLSSCRQVSQTDSEFKGKDGEVKIIQLNPTHGHATAAQSVQLSQIDTNIYVYSPDRKELDEYLHLINSLNTRKDNPTKWNEVVYIGKDYLEKMVQEKKGNVVVLAGNNRVKINYIEHSINAGMNVFSDKPMVIDKAGFERLKNIYAVAEQKGVLMFDMMTERYNLINNIQKSLMSDTLLFGNLQRGTLEHPAIMESSVHHFYRGGIGNRPSWFFDVAEEGEGIVDVTTHLIDLTFWKSFPDEIIDYTKDINVVSAKRWPVKITQEEFTAATSLPEIPMSLKKYMRDSVLDVFANGSIIYQVKGVYVGVRVDWRAATPKDGHDLRGAYVKGTKAGIFIRQNYGQKRPELYVKKEDGVPEQDFQTNLEQSITRLQIKYPGISLMKGSDEYTEVVIPPDLKISYDPIFKVFVGYLENRNMPKWETPNTLAKYYITTTALQMAKE